MPVIFDLTTATGTKVGYHKASRIEINGGVRVIVNSWASKATHDSNGPLAWQDTYGPASPSVLAGETDAELMDAAEAWLISKSGPMSGGTLDVLTADVTLTLAKSQVWATVRTARDSVEFGGFEVQGVGRFDSDQISQQRIVGAIVAAQLAGAGSSWSIVWTLQDNSTTTLDYAGMVRVGEALSAHVEATHQHARELRDMIEAANTVADVQKINWGTLLELATA